MASRFILPFADVGSGIKPSEGAQLFFFETGTSTPKDTFTDVSASTPNSNPVEADSDSNGLFSDIFIVGTYKVILKDKNSIQKWEVDPVSEFASFEASNLNYDIHDTLAGAKSRTDLVNNPSNPMVVIIYPEHAGGRFQVVSGLIANEEDIIQAADPQLQLQLVITESVNIAEFGADILGIADATSAVNRVLVVAETTGLPISSPKATYNLSSWTVYVQTSPLKFSCDSNVIFQGPDLTTIFITVTDDLDIAGIQCENFLADFSYGNLATPKTLKVRRYKSKDSRRAIIRVRATSTGILKNINITRNEIDHAGVDPLLDTRGFFLEGNFDRALVAFNEIINVHGHAINLGDNDTESQSNCKNMRVIGNHVQDLLRDGSGEIQGIRCYGNKAVIADNIVIDVANTNENDCEGIYTKCRYSIISNNNLLDAGRSEASINVKGGTRSGGGTGPDGYAVQVVNNTIRASKPNVKGISLRTDDCFCSGNYLEGISGEQGIYTAAVQQDNICIINNRFRDHIGRLGVFIRSFGKNYEIAGNRFDDITATALTTIEQAILIDTSFGVIENLVIRDNSINLSSTLATNESRAIELTGANNINTCKIRDNTIEMAATTTNKGIIVGANFAASTGWGITGNSVEGNIIESNKLILASVPDNIYIGENLDGHKTNNVTIDGTSVREFYSGQHVMDTGGAGTIDIILPLAIFGLEYSFTRTGSLIRVNSQVGEQLRFNGTTQVSLGSTGANIHVYCVEVGIWDTGSTFGTVT